MSPFEELLERSKAIHLKKREDYTSNPIANPHENFERANEIISWFPVEYKSYASYIGTKLARLSSLLSSGKVPNNESIDDSFLDLVTYCALMYDAYKRSFGPAPNVMAALNSLPKYKDSPDPTEPDIIPNQNMCWHNLVVKNTQRCISCGMIIEKAFDPYFYKESLNPEMLARKA